MSNSKPQEMSKWRERLWPIFSEEMKVFMPMVIIMFCILFNYTVARNLKDSLIVNAPGSSGKSLPWLKLGLVTPLSVLAVIGYAKLSNILSKQKLYFFTLLPFAIYFLLFGFFFYPMRAHFNASPEWLTACKESWPALKNFFPTVAYWSYSIFYAMAELWGNIAIALLFWQFANQITPTAQAKRFYPMFGFWSNLGLVAGGILSWHSEKLFVPVKLANGEVDFTNQVKLYSACMVVACALMGMAYWWLNNKVLTPDQKGEGKKKEKVKMTLVESLKYLMKSRYLMYIAVLMFAYGVAINIVEVSWKDSVGEYFQDPVTGARNAKAYNAFMGQAFVWTGVTTMVFIMFSKNFVRSLGWRFAASVTPWVTMVTGAGFFLFLIAQHRLGGLCALISMSPLGVAVALGLVQNVLTKGVKYALFDPTKEMAYIPLDEESKVKGKAAIDVIGGRAGKAGGSVSQIFVHVVTDALRMSPLAIPILGGILFLVTFWWLWAVRSLSVLYTDKLKEVGESA